MSDRTDSDETAAWDAVLVLNADSEQDAAARS